MTHFATPSGIGGPHSRAQGNRARAISLFVLFWLLLFVYESLRLIYLSPLCGRTLPKFPLLYPPAGWIMFYAVEPRYGFTEVYGLGADGPQRIDPHAIFATRAVGYDNIRRNMLVSVLHPRLEKSFCDYLARKFPQWQSFAVVQTEYPDLIHEPDRILRGVAYRCGERNADP